MNKHTTITARSLGSMLRFWRQQRSKSQMELALDIGISTRHLSYMENNKSKPSKDMLLYIGQALQLPFSQQNSLLIAAGFAPQFKEQPLDSQELTVVKKALQQLLKNHNPFPALVINTRYDILLHNTGYEAFLKLFLGEGALQQFNNALALFFAEDGLRPHINNWDLVAPMLLSRIREEALSSQDSQFLDWVNSADLALPINHQISNIDYGLPMLALEFKINGSVGRFFSTIATIGTPLDLTTQELRLELFYPADEATQILFSSIANS